MATLDVRASSSGSVVSQRATVADILSNSDGTGTNNNTDCNIGYENWGTPQINQLFLAFDTSDIPEGSTINSATLTVTVKAWGQYGSSDTIEAYAFNWGTIGAGDWQGQSEIQSLYSSPGRSAHLHLSDCYVESDTAKNFTSESALTSAIVAAGTTYFALTSEYCRTGTTYSSQQQVCVYTAAHATSTLRPRLVVDYTEAASGRVLFPDFFGGLNCDMTGGI